MRLTEEETKHLAELYERANISDDDHTWDMVNLYFEKLGRKYEFKPEEYVIDTIGNINRVKYCNKCNQIANNRDGILYERVKDNERWQSLPICFSCQCKFHPEKVAKGLMDK